MRTYLDNLVKTRTRGDTFFLTLIARGCLDTHTNRNQTRGFAFPLVAGTHWHIHYEKSEVGSGNQFPMGLGTSHPGRHSDSVVLAEFFAGLCSFLQRRTLGAAKLGLG